MHRELVYNNNEPLTGSVNLALATVDWSLVPFSNCSGGSKVIISGATLHNILTAHLPSEGTYQPTRPSESSNQSARHHRCTGRYTLRFVACIVAARFVYTKPLYAH